jgi:hypothetical protein
MPSSHANSMRSGVRSSDQPCVRRMLSGAGVALIGLGTIVAGGVFAASTAHAAGPTALILDPTVSGGSGSLEATDLTTAGWTITDVSASTWDSMSQAQFASYQLLVLGDPTCSSESPTPIAGAVSDEATWEPVINGNQLIIGTDPVYHDTLGGKPGAGVLIQKGLNYAGAQVGKTGIYLDLSCYYGLGIASGTHAPILDGLRSGFTVETAPNCADAIHVVASAQQLIGITDADLSGWSCSVHEVFSTWPASYVPYAIDTTAPNPTYTAPDGTKGDPYIVGIGGGLSAGSIGLAGPSGTSPIGTDQTITATVQVNGTGVNGASVTLTDISGPDNGLVENVMTNSNGVATFTYTSASAGTDEWTASYTPPVGSEETSNQAAVVWTKASTSFTASATPSSVPYGTTSTLAETGLAAAATGTVIFTAGGSTLCTAALPATSCTTSSALSGGSYPITATYSGDSNYAGSTAATTLTVAPVATLFTASATPSNIAFGSPSTLAESGLPGAATGTVTFASGGVTLCIATLATTSCATAVSLAAGSYPITATYSGDANYAGSTATTALTVAVAGTAFTASATPPSVSFGSTSTLAESGLTGTATGMVTFTSGGSPLCTTTLPTTNCTTSTSLAAGTYPITATYSGDSNHTGSTATTTLTVTAAGTSFTANATPASVSYGSSSTLRENGLSGTATGTVTFASGGATLCTVTLTSTSCATSTSLAAGSYPITATYSGDSNHSGSAATTALTVTTVATSFTASATPSSVAYSSASTLAETGLSIGATGTVTFASGGSTLCTVTLPATSCPTSTSLAAGSYPITATYSGDSNYAGSTATTTLTITLAATTFTAHANPASVPFGTNSSLAESGLPTGATGTVMFASGGLTLCTATLPATSCTPSTFFAVGSYPITATYSGDSNHSGSTASTLLTVTLAATSTTVTSSLNPAAPEQAVVYAARVVSNPGSGTLAFTDNGRPIAGCSAVSVDPLTGGATCSTTYPKTGSHIIGATFSGNADFASSKAATSGVLALTEIIDAAVVVPSTGAQGDLGLGQGLAGAVLTFLGLTSVWRARRRRLRSA